MADGASNISPTSSGLAELEHQSEQLGDEHLSGSSFQATAASAAESQPSLQQQHHRLGASSMVRLPPELDRLCRVPPRQTAGAATGAESTTGGSGAGGDLGRGGTLAGDDASDEALSDALAQVAELDELLARQVECERYARFHRLLHAHENGIPLSEKELAELERLRSHVSLSDPELASTVFKTQVAATLSKASGGSDSAERNQDASFSTTGLGDLLEREIRAEALAAAADDDDTPNFIQRNIERVAEIASGVQLTESEQTRLAELLAEDSDDDDDADDADDSINDMVTDAEIAAGAEAQDGAVMKVESSIQLAKQAANSHMDSEINRLLNRPVQRNPYKLTASQQQRLQMIDSHLQHLSTSALLPASASGSTLSLVSLESAASLSQSLPGLPGLAANTELAPGNDGQDPPLQRLTPDQLELLLEQCRKEQALQSSQALSDVRHSVPTDTLLVEDYESDPDTSLSTATE